MAKEDATNILAHIVATCTQEVFIGVSRIEAGGREGWSSTGPPPKKRKSNHKVLGNTTFLMILVNYQRTC